MQSFFKWLLDFFQTNYHLRKQVRFGLAVSNAFINCLVD